MLSFIGKLSTGFLRKYCSRIISAESEMAAKNYPLEVSPFINIII